MAHFAAKYYLLMQNKRFQQFSTFPWLKRLQIFVASPIFMKQTVASALTTQLSAGSRVPFAAPVGKCFEEYHVCLFVRPRSCIYAKKHNSVVSCTVFVINRTFCY